MQWRTFTSRTIYFPLFGWLDWLTGSAARLERSFGDMDLFYQELIDEHLSPSRPSSMEGDVIDILLQLKRDGQISSIDFTSNNIKAVIMVNHIQTHIYSYNLLKGFSSVCSWAHDKH